MKAIAVTRSDGSYSCTLSQVEEADLPVGDVTIDVEYSSLNYKDGLAMTGRSPVVRSFPMVPGIDLAGTVLTSTDPRYAKGDRVVVNGWGLGETRWGGYAEKARVAGDMVTALPAKFSSRDAMAIGTAGYTAMLCVLALTRHGVTPDGGEVLVTGASGGVGSIATILLAGMGYTVVALTGRPEEADYLKSLGAASIMDRSEYAGAAKPLGRERWAAVVDSAGGTILANACATIKYGGIAAACGLAASMDFPASVAPFILRGVTLAGIDSVYAPTPLRQEAWNALADHLDLAGLAAASREISLSEVIPLGEDILAGRVRGRTVVRVAEQ